MKRIGNNTENITFGKNADFGTGSRLVSNEERDRIQESINESYTEFKNKIIDGRRELWDNESTDSTVFDLDGIAMG